MSEKELFLPFVSQEQIVEFDFKNPESSTGSKFIDAVLRAIDRVGAADTIKVARYMGMDDHMLNHGVRIACGFNMTYLRAIVTIKVAAQMCTSAEKCRLEDVAERLGYGDRSSVWAVLNNKKYRELSERLCSGLLNQRRRQDAAEYEAMLRFLRQR